MAKESVAVLLPGSIRFTISHELTHHDPIDASYIQGLEVVFVAGGSEHVIKRIL